MAYYVYDASAGRRPGYPPPPTIPDPSGTAPPPRPYRGSRRTLNPRLTLSNIYDSPSIPTGIHQEGPYPPAPLRQRGPSIPNWSPRGGHNPPPPSVHDGHPIPKGSRRDIHHPPPPSIHDGPSVPKGSRRDAPRPPPPIIHDGPYIPKGSRRVEANYYDNETMVWPDKRSSIRPPQLHPRADPYISSSSCRESSQHTARLRSVIHLNTQMLSAQLMPHDYHFQL